MRRPPRAPLGFGRGTCLDRPRGLALLLICLAPMHVGAATPRGIGASLADDLLLLLGRAQNPSHVHGRRAGPKRVASAPAGASPPRAAPRPPQRRRRPPLAGPCGGRRYRSKRASGAAPPRDGLSTAPQASSTRSRGRRRPRSCSPSSANPRSPRKTPASSTRPSALRIPVMSMAAVGADAPPVRSALPAASAPAGASPPAGCTSSAAAAVAPARCRTGPWRASGAAPPPRLSAGSTAPRLRLGHQRDQIERSQGSTRHEAT